jgi:hypothetical protein
MSLKPPAGSRSLVKGRSLEIDNYFAEVIASFADDRAVVYGGGKGFGSAALKVDGKIFAMMSSRGAFIRPFKYRLVRWTTPLPVAHARSGGDRQ